MVRQLYGILSNTTFRRMFSHERSKLDLFSEMNSGKVILIDTAKDLLKDNGTEVFGRVCTHGPMRSFLGTVKCW